DWPALRRQTHAGACDASLPAPVRPVCLPGAGVGPCVRAVGSQQYRESCSEVARVAYYRVPDEVPDRPPCGHCCSSDARPLEARLEAWQGAESFRLTNECCCWSRSHPILVVWRQTCSTPFSDISPGQASCVLPGSDRCSSDQA